MTESKSKSKSKSLLTTNFLLRGLLIAAVTLIIPAETLATNEKDQNAQIRLWSSANVANSQICLEQIATITGDPETATALKSMSISTQIYSEGTTTIRAWEVCRQISDAGFDVSKINVTGAARCSISTIKGPKNKKLVINKTLSINLEAKKAVPGSLEAKIRNLICKNLIVRGFPKDNRLKIQFNPAIRDLLQMTSPPYTFEISRQQKKITGWD